MKTIDESGVMVPDEMRIALAEGRITEEEFMEFVRKAHADIKKYNEGVRRINMMRLTGGTGKRITEEAIRTGNWKKVEEEFTPMDLINVLQCFVLTPERREWVNALLKRRMAEYEDEECTKKKEIGQ